MNSSIIQSGNPSGYTGNGSGEYIPAISQCPIVVSFPADTSASFPKHPMGLSQRSRLCAPSILPIPSFTILGILRPPLASAVCPNVSAPSSPNLAASLASPIPTLSKTIHIILLIFIATPPDNL